MAAGFKYIDLHYKDLSNTEDKPVIEGIWDAIEGSTKQVVLQHVAGNDYEWQVIAVDFTPSNSELVSAFPIIASEEQTQLEVIHVDGNDHVWMTTVDLISA